MDVKDIVKMLQASSGSAVSDKGTMSGILKAMSSLQGAENALADYAYKAQREEEKYPISELAERIRKRRKEQKITLQQLGDLTSLSYGTVVAIEHGKQNVSLENILKVTQALGLELWVK